METRNLTSCRDGRIGWTAILSALLLTPALTATAQIGNQNYYGRSVGGISVNADGLLDNVSVDALGSLSQARAKAMAKVPGDLQQADALRKISLRRLDATIGECLKAGKQLPDEVVCLGGLLEIHYVFVYPEQQDIVLVGPAEGWKIDAKGNVVGATTGKPVMLLDDLLVALRTARDTAQRGITCSINPTPQGVQALRTHVGKLRTIGDPAATAAGIEEALGKQQITFTGVPATSHFAGVLVSADYRMKRLAMGFDKSPLRELPSFLSMISGSGRGMSNMMPRWWLEPSYEALLRDEQGTAWELRASAVKCMTEEDFATASGTAQQTGKASPMAQRWADKMTEHYEQLAVAEPIFGELRNCMELAVVGALVARENLTEKAGCSLPVLFDAALLKTMELNPATQVDSRVSMLKKGNNWVISASGGVAIHPSGVVQKARKSDAPAQARAKAVPTSTAKWYWN